MCKLDLFEVAFEILRLEHYETAIFFCEIIKVCPLADQNINHHQLWFPFREIRKALK